jgi:hypothetical protein
MGDRVCRAVIALLTIVGLAAPVGAQRARLDAASRNAWAALLAVHDVRGTDTVVVDRALTSTVAPLRAAAARVIGMNRIVSRYAALRALLQTERDSAAVFALGLASDTGSCDALRNIRPVAP